jgi:hypothetical protein
VGLIVARETTFTYNGTNCGDPAHRQLDVGQSEP